MSSAHHSECPADGVAAGEKSLESLSYRAPLTIFGDWLNDAMAAEKINPNAMTLATVGDDGMPQARSVLLKSFDENGLFFTLTAKAARTSVAFPAACGLVVLLAAHLPGRC